MDGLDLLVHIHTGKYNKRFLFLFGFFELEYLELPPIWSLHIVREFSLAQLALYVRPLV